MVRAFTDGAMGHWIDPSWWISDSCQCSKGRGMCYPVSRMVHIKEHLLLIGKSSTCDYQNGPLPYV